MNISTNGELEYINVGLYAYSFDIIFIEQFQEYSLFYISTVYINMYEYDKYYILIINSGYPFEKQPNSQRGTDTEFCPIYCTIYFSDTSVRLQH